MAKIFVAEDLEGVHCPSSWQSKRSHQENSAQTADLFFEDKSSQSKNLNAAHVQTESNQQDNPANVDMTKLAAWLTNITPRVLQELDKNHKSHVFDEYKLLETRDSNIKLLFTLMMPESHHQSNLITSAINWSSSGGTIAVSRCVREHSSWCEHSGSVALYHMNRMEIKPYLPYCTLSVNSCVTVVSAHPNHSFIIACGTYSGEVTVWNLQRDEAIVIGSITLHSEAVVHMEWLQNFDVTHMRTVLASTSRDGSVIIWSMKSLSNTMKATHCFLLQAEKENTDLGIVCAKFNPCSPDKFLAGIEGGSLAICTTDSKRPSIRKRATFSQDIVSYDPVQSILDGHKGSITGVQWVPGVTDLFLSCGSDSEIHIYSFAEESLVKIIHLSEPCCGLEICISYPNIVVTWGSSGTIYLHDFHTNKMLSPLNLSDTNKFMPLSVVRIQTASSPLFALGDTEGKVSVWEIPSNKFSSPIAS